MTGVVAVYIYGRARYKGDTLLAIYRWDTDSTGRGDYKHPKFTLGWVC